MERHCENALRIAVPLHPQGQRLDCAKRGTVTARSRPPPRFAGPGAARPNPAYGLHRDPADHGGMPVEVFRGRVDDDVEARNGRWIYGVAKVLSATLIRLCRRATLPSASRSASFGKGFEGVSIHSIRVLGRMAAREGRRSAGSTSVELRSALRRRTCSKSGRAAVKIVADQHMGAVVHEFEHGGRGGEPRGKREARGSLLQIGHARARRRTAWVLRAAVLEALVDARRLLHVVVVA